MRVFISYSRKDRLWFAPGGNCSLVPWLQESLRRDGVEVWWDEAIQGGDEWRRRIESEIDRADVALLMISQQFINSEFIEQVELPRIRERAQYHGLRVLPVVLEPSGWREIEFLARWQAVPAGPASLVDAIDPQRPGLFVHARNEVLEAVRNCVREVANSRLPKGPGDARDGPQVSEDVVAPRERYCGRRRSTHTEADGSPRRQDASPVAASRRRIRTRLGWVALGLFLTLGSIPVLVRLGPLNRWAAPAPIPGSGRGTSLGPSDRAIRLIDLAENLYYLGMVSGTASAPRGEDDRVVKADIEASCRALGISASLSRPGPAMHEAVRARLSASFEQGCFDIGTYLGMYYALAMVSACHPTDEWGRKAEPRIADIKVTLENKLVELNLLPSRYLTVDDVRGLHPTPAPTDTAVEAECARLESRIKAAVVGLRTRP